jgi:hypothetical protein
MLIDVEFWIQARSSSELPAGLRYAQMIFDISRTKLSFLSQQNALELLIVDCCETLDTRQINW